MPKQDTTQERTTKQNSILDLEKKYFNVLEEIVLSQQFVHDLLLIEKEIRENYPKFKDTWKLKNKIKVPAERLIRHHIYLNLASQIKGIFPSPISSDFGVKLDDCILCVDCKTLDTVGNANDIRATSVEPNQLSFDNSSHPYIQSLSNLESIDHYSRLPVLTYVIKIIYCDDSYSFKLARYSTPSIVLACIPNGELSSLFNYDIIQNFKTYDYYDQSDGPRFNYHYIPTSIPNNRILEYTHNYCVDQKGYSPIQIRLERGTKVAYYDAINKVVWWQSSESNRKVIKAVKNGSSTRLINDILTHRYDSKNNFWKGYKEYPIPDPLP